MASSERKKERRPYNRACVNCRRKKTRCPGERPSCSSCVRLNQKCLYKNGNVTWQDPRTVDEESSSNSRQVRTTIQGEIEESDVLNDVPYSLIGRDPRIESNHELDCHSTFCHGSQLASLQQSSFSVTKAIRLYFQFCHRQPIWLFEQEEIESPRNLTDHLSCTILALTCRFKNMSRYGEMFAEKARTFVMLSIAKGVVTIATIESLCLLSYHYFIDGNLQLGRFHLGLAFQLCQPVLSERSSPTNEREKRLFWSLFLLEQFYGQQRGLLNVTREIFHQNETDQPSHIVLGLPNLPLPIDNCGQLDSDGPGIWILTLQLSCLWNRTRTYISDCAQNRLKAPWKHDSMYSMIISDLVEGENQFPIAHRYDSVKFWERTVDEVRADQPYWHTWIKTQIMYHAIHTVLNHLFLYIVASQHNQDLAIPNTFWRRSSEQALLHATWIVRLIDMITEKEVQLTDPFFAHAAAIASTLHLYYCCAADPRLRHKSSTDLDKCRKFLKSFTSFSQACEALDRDFDEMSRIAFASNNSEDSPPKIRLSTRLMWDILQFQSVPTSEQSPLLHPSLCTKDESEKEEGTILEIIVATSPDITIDTADGGQAAPVTPLKGVTFSTDIPAMDTLYDAFVAPADSLMLDTSWMWADSSQLLDGSDVDQIDSNSNIANLEASTWWNFGNL